MIKISGIKILLTYIAYVLINNCYCVDVFALHVVIKGSSLILKIKHLNSTNNQYHARVLRYIPLFNTKFYR